LDLLLVHGDLLLSHRRLILDVRLVVGVPFTAMKRNKLLALPLAIALGLEIIAPGGEGQHPHTEKEIILAPEPEGSDPDGLAPFATPPENPRLMDFALRVISPEELKDWWVNTGTTRSGGLVTVLRTQTCGEARFKEIAIIKNLNMPEGQQEVKTAVYLNEDYCISWRNRKMCEQLQEWLLQRGVTTQVLLRVGKEKEYPPDYRTLASNYAPIYDDGDGV
jgi:hypothetical protein